MYATYIAVASLIVSAVTLWFAQIRPWLRTPKLQLVLKASRAWSTVFNVFDLRSGAIIDSFPVLYYYVLVQIGKHKFPATDSQVRVHSVFRLHKDNRFHEDPVPFPLPLAWSFHPASPVSVVKSRACDLGHISQRENCFRLEFLPCPTTPPGIVRREDTIRLEIIADASNCRSSNALFLEIHWDGIWSDDPAAMEQHLRIKSLDSLE
jgi:hypothetical protein